jgi:formate hydrogenlyase subunit 3/multisubunit Na+/H+ antiporter MnhD subunit
MSVVLPSVAALLALSLIAIGFRRSPRVSPVVYAAATAISVVILAWAMAHLLSGAAPVAQQLPLGLPWMGAHLRIDHLSAFFLVVVNLGATSAGLYGIGYGRHETSPERVLPFYPAFVAGMNLVVLADDPFTFLFSWEFMSLASWALVVAHHRERANTEAGYVYLIMAGFGTFCLLLAFGLLAGADGNYTFAAMRTASAAPALANDSMSWCPQAGWMAGGPPRISCGVHEGLAWRRQEHRLGQVSPGALKHAGNARRA